MGEGKRTGIRFIRRREFDFVMMRGRRFVGAGGRLFFVLSM
jgi:hypothetical protein